MLDWIALLCLIGAVILLAALSYVDMKTRLLPNEMVLGFFTLGAVFHLTTLAQIVPLEQIIIGGVTGFCFFYLLRTLANNFYQADALGLGDVKLMTAAGFWLGFEGLTIAMLAGSLAGIIHGLAYAAYIAKKTKTPLTLNRLQIPAGPGFAFGIIIAGLYVFRNFASFFQPLSS